MVMNSVLSPIRSILDVISAPSSDRVLSHQLQAATSLFTPGRERKRLTVWWKGQEIKKRERERNWDPLRQIKTKRSFNGAVACTYVSLGLILWMTCRHLGVITALLLTPCSTLFSSQVFWFITLENSYRPHGGGKSTGVFSFCRVLFCVLHKTRLLTDVHLECSLEPFLFSKVTKEGPCAGLNMLLTYFHKMGTLVRETEAENAKMKDSVSKMCILAFIIRIKAFIIAHTVNGSILPRRHCAIDCIW